MGKKKIIYLLCTIFWYGILNGMDSEDMWDDFIILRSSDKQEFKVEAVVAKQSALLKLIIDGSGLADPIPISDVNSRTLSQLITCLKNLAKQHPLCLNELPESDVLALAQAANLLEIDQLLETAAAQLKAWQKQNKRNSMKTPLVLTRLSGRLSKVFDHE